MTMQPRGTALCRAGYRAAAAGLLMIAVAGLHRFGIGPGWRLACIALGLGGALMLAALVATGAGLLRSGGSGGAASRPATWLALAAAAVTTVLLAASLPDFRAPPINDVTTDLVNPPMFRDAIPVREAAGAENPPMYFSSEVAPVQARAYPDLATIVLPVPADQAFERCLVAARALGWEIIAAVPAEGRIEATATTTWIGFRDDVVVRVAAAADGTRVDLRSKSRDGRGDMGVNAKRIRAFRERLAAP